MGGFSVEALTRNQKRALQQAGLEPADAGSEEPATG